MPKHLKVQTKEAHVELTITGNITSEMALEFEDLSDLLFDVFCYQHMIVIINSNGGEALAGERMGACIRKWRKEGKTIETRGYNVCCSAAAFLMSMGSVGYRRVYPNSYSLYHSARMSSSTITASGAVGLSEYIKAQDDRVLELLVENILASCKERGSAHWPINSLGSPKWRAVVGKRVKLEETDTARSDITEKLKQVFELDQPIDDATMNDLALIDQVIEQ